ncbi:MAG: tRNA (adenosine(37)-N6)-threonylcarbamoyltransferase complex ATPase subunit type 1 TsaE [Solirubrobacterales bacterium]
MTAPLSLDLADEAATRRLGERLAGLARAGDVIALDGTLGTGKSTLARAFVRALTDPDEDVPSPTFTLVQTYESEAGTIWHFDLYRLEKAEDAFELGIEDAFVDGLCLIEWPDRLGRLMPRAHLVVALESGASETARRATLTSHAGAWDDRIGDLCP